MLERSMEEWDSKAKIKKLNIVFDTKKLASGAEYHVKGKAEETTWESDIYRQYFLLQGEIPYDEPLKIGRLIDSYNRKSDTAIITLLHLHTMKQVVREESQNS